MSKFCFLRGVSQVYNFFISSVAAKGLFFVAGPAAAAPRSRYVAPPPRPPRPACRWRRSLRGQTSTENLNPDFRRTLPRNQS